MMSSTYQASIGMRLVLPQKSYKFDQLFDTKTNTKPSFKPSICPTKVIIKVGQLDTPRIGGSGGHKGSFDRVWVVELGKCMILGLNRV